MNSGQLNNPLARLKSNIRIQPRPNPHVCMCVCMCVREHVRCRFSPVQLFATWWTVVHQGPLSMGFSRQEYWSGFPSPPPGIFPIQGSNLCLLYCRWSLYPLNHLGSFQEYCIPQLKIPSAATKTRGSQINKYFLKRERERKKWVLRGNWDRGHRVSESPCRPLALKKIELICIGV